MNNWTNLASQDVLQKTVEEMKKRGFDVFVVDNKEQARQKVLEIIPQGSEVQANTSETLRLSGVLDEIDESGKFASVRQKTMAMNKETQVKEMKMARSVPDYAIGSAHAVTEDGQIMLASNTGSQIPSYAYGAEHVILVLGTQKIVSDVQMGFKRIYEHALPLESERAKKAYGVDRSYVNRILILAAEPTPGRTTVIFINENIGF